MKPTATEIHPTAIIEQGAELGVGVQVGPYAIIEGKAQVGDGCVIASHAQIRGRTQIGADCRIWSFAAVGTEPQDLKYQGEDSRLVIGERNMIREYVNISIGTDLDNGITIIGSDNLLMVNVHVAHDCVVGNSCVIANGVSLAGHVQVQDAAVLGGHSAFHQFTCVGRLSMIAGGSIVVQDVPPYCRVHGDHAKPKGLNAVGLKRHGFSREDTSDIKAMYKRLYQMGLTFDDAQECIEKEIKPSPHRTIFLDFLKKSTRGVCR